MLSPTQAKIFHSKIEYQHAGPQPSVSRRRRRVTGAVSKEIFHMTIPFASFLHRAMESGSRSTVLKPLGWLIVICASSSIASFRFSAPVWMGTTFGALGAFSIILYLVAYVYFGLTDKDALRSEKYSIQKLAIQKGFIGDDMSGYIPLSEKPLNATQGLLPDNSQKEDK